MGHEWDSGLMVRQPSWHRLENAVLKESPKDYATARRIAGLEWEVDSEPIYDIADDGTTYAIPGWQKIVRDDKETVADRILAVRPQSYQVVHNRDFGGLIDTVLGRTDDDPLTFEALFALYGGRQVIALMYFDEPLKMGWDPSDTFRFLSFMSRHDGQGGLRLLPTNVRQQCANTVNISEALDTKNFGVSIRHTSNWKERINEVAMAVQAAKGESDRWLKFAEQLALYKVGGRQREAYLKKYLPISSEDGDRKVDNTQANRTKIRMLLEGDTCAGIANTGYGLFMASTEWSDHLRDHQSDGSYVARQLLRKEEPKARSARILRHMAGIKI